MSNVHYTANEKRLLKILRKQEGRKLSTLQIVEKHYPDTKKRPKPKYARQSVVCVLNSLVRKTKRHRAIDGFSVCKSDRAGPHPNNYWIETDDGDFEKLRTIF